MVSSKGTEISHLTQCKNANKKLFSEAVQKCFNGQTFYFAFSSDSYEGSLCHYIRSISFATVWGLRGVDIKV